jgi:hypothetical protein
VTKRILIGTFIGLLLLVVLFTAASFRAIRSNTRVDGQMSSGHTEDISTNLYQNARLNDGMLGEGPLAEAVFQALEAELEEEAMIQEANTVEMGLERDGGPYVLVALISKDINWPRSMDRPQ